MEPFLLFWDNYLYIPLYNLLMWLYTGWADYNIGWAVVFLTVIIRIILLPFSILSLRGEGIRLELAEKLKEVKEDYKNDPVKQKMAARRLFKKYRIRHWPKAVVLGVQFLVLVLLYKVFVSGLSSYIQMEKLYAWVPRPDFVDPMFFGFDMTQISLILPAVVAAYIFAEILVEHWMEGGENMNKREQLYSILFPAVSFLALALLPAIKSIFVLTSLIISTIISMIIGGVRMAVENNKKAAAKAAEEDEA